MAMVSTLSAFDLKMHCFPCSISRVIKKKISARVFCNQSTIVPVEECIAKIKDAIVIQNTECGHNLYTITGKQWFMDMKGDYRFTWCMDGRFYEQFKGEKVTVEWAHDGENSWYADFAGRVTKLQLDSLETCLLTAWIRTGFWLTEKGQSKLLIKEKPDSIMDLPVFNQPQIQMLYVKIKEFNKVVACVVIDTNTWLPLRVITRVCGGVETWVYSDWQVLQPECECKVPFEVSHVTASGGVDSICALEISVESASQASIFLMPLRRVIPRDGVHTYALFDDTVSPHVQISKAESGHYLVRPLVDGQDIGYFIVDSGASGFTIAAEQCRRLGMEGFGEVYLLGVESRTKSRFVRGKQFHLGGLKLMNPIYIEASIQAVEYGSEPIVGICGFDLFFHCVVEMSMAKGVLSMFNPANFTSSLNLQWQEMYIMENVPHLQVKINSSRETLLLLDTGAGGADLILHARAAKEYGLTNEEQLRAGSVKGLHASDSISGIQAGVKEIQMVEAGGLVFEKPKCLILPSQVGNVDISVYTSGLLCGNLLKECLVVLDYQNSRFALVR